MTHAAGATDTSAVWDRGLGLYATGWINSGYTTINKISNATTGTLSGGTLSSTSGGEGMRLIPGFAVGVSLQRFGFPVRAELEISGRSKIEHDQSPLFSNDTASTTLASVIKNKTLMVNAYLDFHRPGKDIQPYIGFGLGQSWSEIDTTLSTSTTITKQSNNENEFAWALMAGFGYRFSEAWLLDTRYRYVNLGAAQWGPATITTTGTSQVQLEARDISSHEFGLGLRYHF